MRTTHNKKVDTGRKTAGKSPAAPKPRLTDRELEDIVPHLRGAEVEDTEWRKAHPNSQLRSAYLSIVGENPEAGPGDHRLAEGILVRIKRAQEHGGWTRSEWSRLRKMELKWRLRLSGRDFRFELVGNKRGGLPAPLARLLRLRKQMGMIRRTLDAEKSEA